ncbi:MAG: VIT1/CCC1 transporter family protein, partial [Acidobacteriota bacterium]
AEQLMAHDALAAHSRDELGLSDSTAARPLQAALASAATFALGAALPHGIVLVAPPPLLIPYVTGAYAGGAPVGKAALRVTFWGVGAMALTAWVGAMFGAAV